MTKKIKLVLALLISIQFCFAQKSNKKMDTTKINDCPYIFYKGNTVEVKWVVAGVLKKKVFSSEKFKRLKIKTCEEFVSKYVKIKPQYSIDEEQQYHDVSKIVVLSDIHGQHDLFMDLIKANNIVDKKGNWNFGNGHFVIVGDIFDRGDKVTETLWFVYKLEQQANKAGGKVHYLLGNHEVMVLKGSNSYVNEKYRWVAKQMGMKHQELYGAETLMGEWIRTKPVAIAINDIAFAHAGFSPEFTERKYDISTVNNLFHHRIIDHKREDIKADKELTFMTKKQGPIWYRGYFRDEDFSKEKAQKILDDMGMKHIVVGHTSFEKVLSHFDGLIYSVDSSMKKGKYAEVLFWENGIFYRGDLKGKRTNLN